MLKIVFPLLLLLFNIQNISAQSWSNSEIAKIESFSIQTLQKFKDPSNKYLNDQAAIDFGKDLFSDTRLSSNGKVSCHSCHIEKFSFSDSKNLAIGLRKSFRNTPTLLNVGAHDWFFADGAKDSLWAQALSSIENPAEQDFTRLELIQLISSDEGYRKQFQNIFKEHLLTSQQLKELPKKAGPNAKLNDLIAWKKLSKTQRTQINILFTNVGKAIAAYVSTFKSKPNRFDNFVEELSKNKHSTKLNASEKRGLNLFMSKETGCSNCHSGPLFSNKTFHNIATGIPGKDNGRSEIIESLVRDEFNCLGPYSDAQAEQCVELNYINRDKHQLQGTYKTPTLRGLKNSSPYMHDGRFENLHEVLGHYISVSQPKNKSTDLTPISLNKEQQTDIINFLLTL